MNQEQFNKSMQTTKNYVDSTIQDYIGGKKQVYLTQAEYDLLSELEKNDATKVYNITDATEQVIPTKTSQLTNDSDYATNASVDEKIASVSTTRFEQYNSFYNSIIKGTANPSTSLSIKTYVGGGDQPTHPKVLYFKNGWNGHKYWMSYTPYPNNNNAEENPCITYSDDGYNWSEVGISNPIARPTLNKYFFSDSHLVYREDTNTLECWFRECCNDSGSTDYNKETIWRMTSTDGVMWSNKQELFSHKDSMAEVLSPAVIYDEGKYKIWICYKRQSLKYYESNDGTNWQYIRDISINPNDNFKVWHFDIIKTSKGYEFVGCYQYNGQFDKNNYIYYSKSDDNITYSSPIRILGNGPAGSFDDLELYRPCLTKVENKYMMYYGAQKNIKIWSIGLVEAPSMELLNAIMVSSTERNERLKKIEDRISALENGSTSSMTDEEVNAVLSTVFGEKSIPSDANLPDEIPSNDLVLITSSKGITNESEDKEVWKDLSGNNNHLVLNNFGFNSSNGWINGGLKCDGASTYLSLVNEDSFGLDVSKDVTVMIAVKGTTLDSSASRCFFQTSAWGQGLHVSYYKGEGLEFKIGSSGGIKKALPNDTTGQNIINICAIKSNGNNKLYYNNVLAASSTTGTSFSKGKLRVMCGEGDSFGDYADGTIYSVAIYNRALSEEEITAIYNYQLSLMQ